MKIKNKNNQSLKFPAISEKKKYIKQVRNKNTKVRVFISSLIAQPNSDIQDLLININIVI